VYHTEKVTVKRLDMTMIHHVRLGGVREIDDPNKRPRDDGHTTVNPVNEYGTEGV